MKEDKKVQELDWISKLLILVALLFVILSFLMPYLLTQFSLFKIDLSETGSIGDTIGGIMNPFVAIGGIIITFLAFYMQFKANHLQRELFNEQIKKEKDQFREEQNSQQATFINNQFENQFYEMIKLHKDNVNDIFVNIIRINKNNRAEYQLFGRKNFEFFVDEVEIAYKVAKYVYKTENKYFHLEKAYSAVFHGIKFPKERKANKPGQEKYIRFTNILFQIKKGHKINGYKKLKLGGIMAYTEDENLNIIPKNELYYDIFDGYASFLGHYYRQLFQTVKFVAQREFLSYEEKRKYLRILRAQLTNYEQVMLFYNWKANFGSKWENKENKFFTDFRMIHNIYNDLLISDFSMIKEFDLMTNNSYRKESGRKNDALFEFEDWKYSVSNKELS